MKRIYFYTIILFTILAFLTSCEKDPIGGTATEAVAGEWYVTADAIDTDGSIVYEDVFDLGHFQLDTYNTAQNGTDSIWVTDNAHFWNFKVKIGLNLNSMSFGGDSVPNIAYDSKVLITEGKVLLGAAKTPSGSVADSIVFTVGFKDDTYPSTYGYAAYRVSGYRYTGLANDD